MRPRRVVVSDPSSDDLASLIEIEEQQGASHPRRLVARLAIKPIFGDCDPRTVRMDDISPWRAAVEETVSLLETHCALKIWRALWKVSAALGYCVRDADPAPQHLRWRIS
jgi:hypothetical protein